jgi:hypothetical protein
MQTDMYLYVTSNDADCEAGVAAFALPCLFDYSSNRPVLAVINLCSQAINTYTSDKLLATAMHEITHSLVRSRGWGACF